jgi:hypothetical protein
MLDTLEMDRLQSLIETLQLAKQVGFSSTSSTIVALLEVAIDLNLQISNLLKRGSFGPKTNKHMKFLDLAEPNELGNSKQISWHSPRKFYWEPESEEILSQITSFYVQLKKQSPLPKSFMDLVKRKKSNQRPARAHQERKTQSAKRRAQEHKNSAYHRRQRQKERP